MSQMPLFAEDQALEGPGLEACLHRGWLAAAIADQALTGVVAEVPWEQHHITVFGRRSSVPRLDAWMGDPGAIYSYSGIEMTLHDWTPTVARLRDAAAAVVGVPFNSVLINRYRDGRDGVAWHADDEPELGPCPVIAALSLGASRTFQMKRREQPEERRSVELHRGDLLVMSGSTQAEWLHQIPKTSRRIGERVSLTFRSVRPRRESL